MRIAMAGSSGVLGQLLTSHLRGAGHEVVRLVRRPPEPGERQWDPESGRIDDPGLEDVDAVINFSGAGIADVRWSPERKDELRRSRIASTVTLVNCLTHHGRCRRLLNASAIGYYGNTGPDIVDEDSPRGEGFLARLVADWEQAASQAPVPTAYLRSGHVLTPSGGFLGKQWLPFRLGLGGRIGDGRQFISWIAAGDYVEAVRRLLTLPVTGPVNLVAPEPVTNATFTRIFAQYLDRPAVLPIPLLALRTLLGGELVAEALLSGTRVHPRRLLEAGFTFRHPELAGALKALG